MDFSSISENYNDEESEIALIATISLTRLRKETGFPMKKIILTALVALSVTGYSHAEGNAEAGKAKAVVCGACHGPDGNSAAPNFPKLAGQGEKYLLKQMKDIKGGDRNVLEMTGMLSASSDQDLEDLAAYFASQNGSVGYADKEQAEIGEKIYRAGIADRGIAACAACHSPSGQGNDAAAFPKLGGQHAAYTVKQLKDFRDSKRANDPNAMMRDNAYTLRDDEIDAVAQYIQGLH
ncbi:c-type cytochrome [Litoribacillus peritrichatus]|uniref:C-type cytochrome n=2 Tax=Litoribacillus peritrichatus TaxID=718191 RepID=A0ABP7NDW5_9GAMM